MTNKTPLPTDGTDTGAVAEAAWNSISDEHNQWSALSLDERDTFTAFAAAILAAAQSDGETK